MVFELIFSYLFSSELLQVSTSSVAFLSSLLGVITSGYNLWSIYIKNASKYDLLIKELEKIKKKNMELEDNISFASDIYGLKAQDVINILENGDLLISQLKGKIIRTSLFYILIVAIFSIFISLIIEVLNGITLLNLILLFIFIIYFYINRLFIIYSLNKEELLFLSNIGFIQELFYKETTLKVIEQFNRKIENYPFEGKNKLNMLIKNIIAFFAIQPNNAFRKMSDLTPNYTEAMDLNRKGIELYKTGSHEMAIEILTAAIKSAPNYAEVRNNLGLAIEKNQAKDRDLGNYDKYDSAIECYDEAIRLDPNYANAWYNKGHALYMKAHYNQTNLNMVLENCEKAIYCFYKAKYIDPLMDLCDIFSETYYLKSEALRKLSRDDEARKAMDKANKIKQRAATPP